MTNQLDLSGLARQLDTVVAQATAGTDSEALIQQARRLVTKVREAPVVSPPLDDAGTADWYAVADDEDVVCWRGDDDVETILYGGWADGRLRIVNLAVGDVAWGMRITSTGTSYICSGERVEGSADRRILERIKSQTHKARERAAREVAARVRICPRCSWMNRPNTTVCAMCGVAGVPWAQDASAGQQLAFEQVDGGQPIRQHPARPDADTFEMPGPAAATRVPPPPARQPVARELRGNIVISGVVAGRQATVAQAAGDACQQAGVGRLPLPWIAAQLERLPALLCRNVTPAQADYIRRRLADAGASTRFERDPG